MNNELPTLTFEPLSDDTSTQEVLCKEILNKDDTQIQKPVFDESTLSPEERKIVDDFSNQIDRKSVV